MNSLLLTLCLFSAVPTVEYEKVPRPADAVLWALADVQAVKVQTDRQYFRYCWLPPWATPRWPGAISFAVNTAASHSTRIQHPVMIANGWMMRWDLRLLSNGDPAVYSRLVLDWDRLAINEPYFHFSLAAFGGKEQFPPVAPHVDNGAFLQLAKETNSRCPVVRADYLLVRMLSTLDGGMYYDFLQIERKPAVGSAQDAFLKSIGANLNLSRDKLAQTRSALLRSNVTGKPRRIDFVYASFTANPAVNTGLVMITHDTTDESVKANENPILNLFAFEDKARELIAEKSNGLHVFLLFNNKGDLQDSVPDNIARDSEIPAPHTARLQASISCIRCHGPDEGLKTAENDIATLVANGFDVFDDLKAPSVGKALESLATFYLGKLDKPVRRGRDDYSEAVFVATCVPTFEEGTTVTEVSRTVAEIYGSLAFDAVTAERAAMEAGFRVRPNTGKEFLKSLVPPLPASADGRVREHPFIAFLKSGVAINRKDFDAVFPDLLVRSEQASSQWSADNANQE